MHIPCSWVEKTSDNDNGTRHYGVITAMGDDYFQAVDLDTNAKVVAIPTSYDCSLRVEEAEAFFDRLTDATMILIYEQLTNYTDATAIYKGISPSA